MGSNMVVSLCTILKPVMFHTRLDIVSHLIIIFRYFGKNVSVGSAVEL